MSEGPPRRAVVPGSHARPAGPIPGPEGTGSADLGVIRVCRALAFLLGLVLIASWRSVEILARQLFVDPLGVLSLITGAYLILLVGTIVGLYRVRPWGFLYAYLLIPFATALLGVSFVPWVARFFRFPASAVVVALCNVTVLATVMLAHARFEAARAGTTRPG